MASDPMRQECLDLISALFDAGEDMLYPVAPGASQVTLCGSAGGYVLRSAGDGPKAYASAEEVLDVLVEVERLSGETEPLVSLHETLRDIS